MPLSLGQMLAFFSFSPGQIGVFIPIVLAMIPIVAILTSHQQKMAQIVHGSKAGQLNDAQAAEIERLRHELQDLKALVHQQTIAIDNLSSLPRSQSQIEHRLGV